MYNNPLGKKPGPRSSHRKIITFISKLRRSPAAQPSQPPAPSPRAARPAGARQAVRGGACARARACVRRGAGGARGRAGGGRCGCINLFNQKTQTHHTKGGVRRRPGGGEQPRPRPAPPAPPRGRAVENGGAGGTRKFEKDGPESLRLTSFIYQKWYIYKYS